MANFWGEMTRRNVFKVGTVYVIVAWLLIQVADTTFPAFEIPDWVLRAVVFVLLLGLPMALVFAWAFEITPEGLKRTQEVEHDKSITNVTGRKIDFIFIGVLLLAVAYFTVDKFVLQRNGTSEPAAETAQVETDEISIAVLPFRNMSPDPENQYFSDGISEELLNVLANVEDLKVISRTTSFAYRDSDLPLRDIANELNVNHILEGSVRKSNNRVRITAQLIHADSDSHLWSDSYDRTLDDIFVVQEEISKNIVASLTEALGYDAAAALTVTAPTQSIEAYELYLQGRHLFLARGVANLTNAIERLELAVEIDPDFARAWSTLAGAWGVISDYSPNIGRPEAVPKSKRAAERAIELDPNLSEAYATLGLLNSSFYAKRVKAEDNFDKAIELDPQDPMARLWKGIADLGNGQPERARVELEAAVRIDPALGIPHGWLGCAYFLLGDEDRAVESWQRGLELGYTGVNLVGLWDIALRDGDAEEAKKYGFEFVRAFTDESNLEEALGLASAVADAYVDFSKREDVMNELEQVSPELLFPAPWIVYTDFGDPDKAVELLETILVPETNPPSPTLTWLWNSGRESVLQHPEFMNIADTYGLLEYWEQKGYPVGCRAENGGLYCD